MRERIFQIACIGLILLFAGNASAYRQITPSGQMTPVAGHIFPGVGARANDSPVPSPNRVAAAPGGGFYFVALEPWNGIYQVSTVGILTRIAGRKPGDLEDRAVHPWGLAVNKNGEVFYTERGRIRKIVGGVVSDVAGTGVEGFSADGILAVQAKIRPLGPMVFDRDGNLFFFDDEDSLNIRIRKIDRSGKLTTVVGPTFRPLSENGRAEGLRYFRHEQTALAIDDRGNLFFMEFGSQQIFKADSRGVVSLVAGGRSGFGGDGGSALKAGFSSIRALAVDGKGGLLVLDALRVRRIAPNGNIETLAGQGGDGGFAGDGGSAKSARFFNPGGIAVEADGAILIADQGNNRIRRIAPNGTIRTAAGAGEFPGAAQPYPALRANLPSTGTLGMVVDRSGNLLFIHAYQIWKVNRDGVLTVYAGSGRSAFTGDGGPATAAGMTPVDIAMDSEDNLLIVDSNRVRKIDNITGIIRTIAGNGNPGQSGEGGPAIRAELSPNAVTVDRNGVLFIATGDFIRKVSAQSVITTVAGAAYSVRDDGSPVAFNNPLKLAADGMGNLYVVDRHGLLLHRIRPDGIVDTLAATKGWTHPRSVAVDRAGNLYIADSDERRVFKRTPEGLVTTVVGNGETGWDDSPSPLPGRLRYPVAVAVGGDNLFISDGALIWRIPLTP